MLGLVVLLGCAEQAYTPGDWELDVVAALPVEAETLRICVQGAGVTTVGAGNGRAAVRALPPDDTEVRLEVYDLDGVGLFSTSWLPIGDDAPLVWASPSEFGAVPCTADGDYAEIGADARLLVTRFVQP